MAQDVAPLISICIPSYKRISYLQRLLDSIEEQGFRNFEVVVSDDSPDTAVKDLLEHYSSWFKVRYFQNVPALGTPENWNEGMRQCKGEWIKLMHDDDWFAHKDSLQAFADQTGKGKKFFFSAYANQFEAGDQPAEEKFFPASWKKRILKAPMALLAYNVIGPPSVTMVHRSITELYDNRLKWRVDMEYYIRLLNQLGDFVYINQVLVNVGISNSQVTHSCLYQPQVELPEGKLLLEKYGAQNLKNLWVYDAWWRLLRNMKIFTVAQLEEYAPGKWPAVLETMVGDLAKTPAGVLETGVFSKSAMFVSYLKNQSAIS